MTHPGEQFYPQGVRWDDPIARGTLPDLLSAAAAEYRRAARDRIPRPADQLQPNWKTMVEIAASAVPARRLRQEHFGRAVPRQFAGSSRQFLRRAEGRCPRRAPVAARRRDRAVAQAVGLRRARARHLQPLGAAADRAEVFRQGPARPPDRLRRYNWGRSVRRRRRCPITLISSPTSSSSTARRSRRNGPRYRPTTSRCCNIPAAPPDCRRARC